MEVNGPEIARYGVISKGIDNFSVKGLVEKPEHKNAPSNLASIGRYVLDPYIFKILRKLKPGAGGEVQLADAINQYALMGKVEAVPFYGVRFDCGSIDGFIEANNFEYNRRLELK